MDFVQAANSQSTTGQQQVQPWQVVDTDKGKHVRQISDETYTPTTTTATSANEEELTVPNTNPINVSDFETLEDSNNVMPDTNVSADQIYSKFHEYDMIENQLAKIQAQGIQAHQSTVHDKKQLKRQIKQIGMTYVYILIAHLYINCQQRIRIALMIHQLMSIKSCILVHAVISNCYL